MAQDLRSLTTMTKLKCSYNELIKLPTFEERFEYLKQAQIIGEKTFGSDRYLNQLLYKCGEWKAFRNDVIIRDKGCDLGIDDDEHKIPSRATVHHINPITAEQIINRDPAVFDMNNVITMWDKTHKLLHFGNADNLPKPLVERKPNDTCPWRN